MKNRKTRFSNATHTYDEFALPQNHAGHSLCKLAKTLNPSSILDIGCGTGKTTSLLSQQFPEASLIGLDHSREMIDYAQNHYPSKKIYYKDQGFQDYKSDKNYDLIFSNATFQWLSIKETLPKCHSLVEKGGSLIFSYFGPKTYQELQNVLATEMPSKSFLTLEKLLKHIEPNWDPITIHQEIITQPLKSIQELLEQIKYTGANQIPTPIRSLWTKTKLQKIKTQIEEKYHALQNTFEIYYFHLKKT